MTFRRASWQGLVLLLGCWWLSGCFPPPEGVDDEKNSVIADARAKKAAYNYQGAIESLEKALEANPQSAAAHWELGLICYQNVTDYAAAIYHFEKLLKIRPDWKQADTVKQFINVCKMEIAKTVPLGPQTPQVQKEIDKLAARQVELTQENTKLREVLQSYQAAYQQVAAENLRLKQQAQAVIAAAAATPPPAARPAPHAPAAGSVAPPPGRPAVAPPSNPPPASPVVPARPLVLEGATSAPPSRTPQPGPITNSPALTPPRQAATPAGSTNSPGTPPAQAAVATPAGKSYTVKWGDTLYTIARQHRVKMSDLIAANPDVDPNKLKLGQALRIPPRQPGAN